MMHTVYFDQAATSFPKAPGVADAMVAYLTHNGANVNRGGYAAASDAQQVVLSLREQLSAMFGSPDVEACILTPGATFGLNQVLKGYLRAGDHVLVSSVEHNAVMRPLHQLAGVLVEKVPCAVDGSMAVSDLEAHIRPDTRLVCLSHASNVCGTLLPVMQVGQLCAARGISFVVDAAQTAGHLPLSREALHADALVLPAHKGILGPQGVGAALMSRAFAQSLIPLVAGGTGSRSSSEIQPTDLPDQFEAGTQNIPGFYGFAAALRYVAPRMTALHAQAMVLCGRLLAGAARLPGVRILGKQGLEGRVPVVALDFPGLDNAMVSHRLAKDFGIATRCGLHCAPAAHHTLGSFPQGAVRFSIGASNTEAEVDLALDALRVIVTERRTFAQV